MHSHRHEETAREFLARRRMERKAHARVEIMRIVGRMPISAFMIDQRDGMPFLAERPDHPS